MQDKRDLKRILGENVKIRRERKGLSQEQLAEKAGVSKNTISDIETGDKFARANTLVALAKALETEVYELLKPKDITPDKAEDIVEKYYDVVKDALEQSKKNYIENIK